MLFGLGSLQRHEINTIKVIWSLIGFLRPVSYHYRTCIVVSSCDHFSSFSNKVSVSSPSELRVQLVFILSASAVLDARRGIYVCVSVCVLQSCALYASLYLFWIFISCLAKDNVNQWQASRKLDSTHSEAMERSSLNLGVKFVSF